MPILPNLFNMFKGKSGGAPDESAQQRVDMYREKGWAPDDTIDKNLWDAQPGVPGGIGPPAPEKQAMFGQFGDPKKAMGNIWDQLKGGGQKLGKGLQKFGSDWEANYEKQLKSQGLWEGADNTNPYGAFNTEPTDASESVNTYDEAIGPPAPGEEPYPEVDAPVKKTSYSDMPGNTEMFPAGKNIFGQDIPAMTKDGMDEMANNFVMGGFGGGGGGFGKMWSNIKNWIR
tara:strand:- start:27 stop:713 length:687 start_codon:yes stop_codon:yes gene_type:complete